MSDGNPVIPRLLYLQTTPVPPPADAATDRFVLFADRLRGEILQPLWFRTEEEAGAAMGPGTVPYWQRGSFRYHWFPAEKFTGLSRRLRTLWFYVAEGLRAHKEEPIDCVMTYSHMTTAFCGIVLKWLTGAKLIVEIVAAPELVYMNEYPNPGLKDRLMKMYSDFCLYVTMTACDHVHLLYPGQLDHYPLLKGTSKSAFVEFVPVKGVPRTGPTHPPVILLVGAPWYRKGADLLIKAFLRLSPDFPEARLRILGHYPDRDRLEALTEGSPKIEILRARTNPEAHRMIAEATIFALPSRCEGTARVLLEAMAAGVPVVTSDVAGASVMIRDEENGLLFPSCDVDALEQRLRRLLADPELRARFGQRGHEMARSEFSEEAYVDHFVQMIHDVTSGD